MQLLRLAAAAATGYLVGTVPSADVAARLGSGGRVDLRREGTGNPGGANVLLLLGPRWGYAVMLADIAKGAAASGLGRRLAGTGGAHLAGTASVVGHCFPLWNGFRGGKGGGCSAGQCLATFPVYFPVDVGVAWLAASRRWRHRTYAGTVAASALWVLSALLWWRRGWPNAWGPRPSAALPLAAAATSALIVQRFRAAAWRPDAAAAPATPEPAR